MRALIVYESMYGNTRLVAEAIGRGLAPAEVTLVPGEVRRAEAWGAMLRVRTQAAASV
ncbi:hypothetical protein [Cryobacterium serini]|uniref:hypothetical protein n=1 Tax=Cryobacterium serini TaxID=1259201 RepID=UPI0018E0ACDD|nr:hypothetical protein [Cryobacterium serini]